MFVGTNCNKIEYKYVYNNDNRLSEKRDNIIKKYKMIIECVSLAKSKVIRFKKNKSFEVLYRLYFVYPNSSKFIKFFKIKR